MAKIKEQTTIQHIFEVRLKKRYLTLIDSKGKLLSKLLKELGIDKFRVDDNRIEVISDDLRKMYFLSTGNFGFRLDSFDNFEIFKTESNRLLKILYTIEDFNPEILRLGTKSTIFYHKKGLGFDSIRNTFREKIYPQINKIEEVFGGEEIDVGMLINFKEGNTRFDVKSGPIKKSQLLRETVYAENSGVYESLADSGLFLSIDLSRTEEGLTYKTLKEKIEENVNKIEEKYNSFKNWLLFD